MHPDESQNCKNQSCSSNYMPSNAASKSLFYVVTADKSAPISGYRADLYNFRNFRIVDQRCVSKSCNIIWEMNIFSMFTLIRLIGRHIDDQNVSCAFKRRFVASRNIGIYPLPPIVFLEKHGKFSFIIGHFERWSGTIKTLPHTRMYKYINPFWSHDKSLT